MENKPTKHRRKPANTFRKDLRALKAIQRDLARRAPKMSFPRRNYARNIIEQVKQIEDAADIERIKPYMAYQMRRLEQATNRE